MFNRLMQITIVLMLSGCAITPERLKDHLNVFLPDRYNELMKAEKYPVIFFFQGSGGNNRLAYKWANWFAQHGVASVIIDNAGVRNMRKLYRVDYGSDLAPALATAAKNPKLDTSHYAVMGFSRGGSAALASGAYLTPKDSKPDFVFALYPGDKRGCSNSHGKDSSFHVFYGEIDDWGKHSGAIFACRSMAKFYDNASFHLLQNAHHGYDMDYNDSYSLKGRTFYTFKNKDALKKTQSIILKAMRDRWGLPNK